MKRASIVACALLALSCSSGARYSQAIVALVDVSGTYADQRPEVVDVIRKGLLPRLTPGDTLVVIRIDNESYGKQNVEAWMASATAAQKGFETLSARSVAFSKQAIENHVAATKSLMTSF